MNDARANDGKPKSPMLGTVGRESPPNDVARLRREVELLSAENFSLKRQLTERERRLDELLSSTSWRMTAPLRRLVDRLRSLRRRRPAHRRNGSFAIDRDDYQLWRQSYASVDSAMRARLTARLDQFATRPLMSVIMPSYNIDPEWMRAAIESVRRQIYPHWELCISDDASTLAGVRELLERYAAEDKRIRVTFRATNGHISANSNSALELAGGDYVALMDADDVLAEDALFWVAHEMARHPETDLVFTDEDKIDESGKHFDPYFKSAWNPALMLAQNAFCHLGVYRRSLVEQVGRFREGYEGAQDHDLVLRCAEATTSDRIRHIPRVLYHWRAASHSTAADIARKPYAERAGVRTIADCLRRRGIAGHVEPAVASFFQVVYEPPDPTPLVSIIMPTTMRNSITRRCLESILSRTCYANFELLLVATDRDLAAGCTAFADCLADPRVRALTYQARTFNFSAVNNFGVAEARGELLCFLNDDIEVISEDWLAELVARANLEGVGAAGPMLYYPSDIIQHAGVLLGVGGVADHAFRNVERRQIGYFARAALEQDLSCLTAACLLVRRTVFEAIGGFDADLPVAFNDVDLCIRIRRTGARIIWTPAAELYHHESLSFGAHDSPDRIVQFGRDVALMRQRWSAILDSDPCYNPNLSLDPGFQFRLAVPPRTSFASSGAADRVSRTSALA